jgi:hypothetical protein
MFVIGPELELASFTKMSEVFDSRMCGQQLTIESRITGFGVGQFPGEKSKGPPMVA